MSLSRTNNISKFKPYYIYIYRIHGVKLRPENTIDNDYNYEFENLKLTWK